MGSVALVILDYYWFHGSATVMSIFKQVSSCKGFVALMLYKC